MVLQPPMIGLAEGGGCQSTEVLLSQSGFSGGRRSRLWKGTLRQIMNFSIGRPVILLAGLALALGAPPANPDDPSPLPGKPRQIVVLVYVNENGLRFKLPSSTSRDSEYKKSDANYFLAELKLHEGDCQLIEVVDDRAPLSAITEVSEMAINAGFKDIRPFIYWHKTGRMAQVQFGPPIKFTMNANKIEQRVEKEK